MLLESFLNFNMFQHKKRLKNLNAPGDYILQLYFFTSLLSLVISFDLSGHLRSNYIVLDTLKTSYNYKCKK